MKQFTDRQIAIILIRDWLQGGNNPYHLYADEISYMAHHDSVSEARRERILGHVTKIVRPFEKRVEDLFSNIKNID